MTCTIKQNGLDTMPLHFYHYLRRKGYAHRSAVTSVLMYYSPSKEDLAKRLRRRRRYIEAQASTTYTLPGCPYQILRQHDAVTCACCSRGDVTVTSCPECDMLICQDCMPPFGAHTCEPE